MMNNSIRAISNNLVNFIKQFESYSSVAYICPAGKKTIGYGHVLTNGENYNKINEADALALLLRDIYLVQKNLSHTLKNTHLLEQCQYEAIISLIFNIGVNNFFRSTLRQKIIRFDHDAAANEFLKWVYCGKIILKGLVTRRKMEKALYQNTY